MSIYENFVRESFENFLHNLLELVERGVLSVSDALHLAAEGRDQLNMSDHYEEVEA